MARLPANLQAQVEEFGFEFSEVPEVTHTRRSKYAEMWEAAKEVTRRNPGKALRVREWEQASQPYNIAKQINNGDRKEFEGNDASEEFTAVAAKTENDTYAIWLTYNGQ